MFIYGLKNCDTCRRARKAVPELIFVDVREDGVPQDVLENAYAALGDVILNTRSTTWRGLDAMARKEPVLALLNSHPTLMKRPLIVIEERFFIGWNKEIERDVNVML